MKDKSKEFLFSKNKFFRGKIQLTSLLEIEKIDFSFVFLSDNDL